MSDIDDLTNVQDMPVAPDQCAAGDKQRLRIHVPNVSTTLTMGAKSEPDGVRNFDGGPINYDGFGVHTKDGHVYILAEDGVAAVKATKEVTIHSSASTLDIRSKENAYLGSDSQTYIHGRTGTLIVGGDSTAPAWHESLVNKFSGNKFYPSNEDPDPWDLEELAEVNEVQQSTVQTFTTVQGVIMGIEKMLAGEFKGFGWVTVGFGLMKVVSSLLAKKPGPGVGIHGTDGVLITSPKMIAAHAHQTILLSSGFTADIQAVFSTSIGSGLSTFVGAGMSTTLMGGKGIKVIAGKDTEVASRFGEVKVMAPTISFGIVAPAKPQMPTKTVAVESKEKTSLSSEGDCAVIGAKGASIGGGKTVDVVANDTASVGAKDVNVAASKALSLSAGTKFAMICGKSQVSADKNRIVLSVGDPAPKPDITEDDFYQSRNWANFNEFLNAWRAKQKDYHAKLKHAKSSWTQVKVTDSKIQLKIKGGAEMKGDKSGWKVGGNTLVVKK